VIKLNWVNKAQEWDRRGTLSSEIIIAIKLNVIIIEASLHLKAMQIICDGGGQKQSSLSARLSFW